MTVGILQLVFMVLAVGVCVTVGRTGAAMVSRRYRLAWSDPGALVKPATWSTSMTTALHLLGVCELLTGIVLLAVQVATDGSAWLGGLVLFAGGMASSIALLFQAGREWRRGLATTAAGLLTVGVAAAAMVVLAGGAKLAEVRLAAVMCGLAILTAFWPWVCGVWRDQLDGEKAWTTAGRMHGLADRLALMTAVAALCCSALLVWAGLKVAGDTSSGTLRVYGVAGHLLLAAGLFFGWRRWRQPVFTPLIAASLLGLGTCAWLWWIR